MEKERRSPRRPRRSCRPTRTLRARRAEPSYFLPARPAFQASSAERSVAAKASGGWNVPTRKVVSGFPSLLLAWGEDEFAGTMLRSAIRREKSLADEAQRDPALARLLE